MADSSPGPSDSADTSFLSQVESIVENESESERVLSEDEETARNGHQGSIANLPEGLYTKVLQCGDRLVTMAEQLIDNETSNLAECYMSIRSCFDGGKQYNRIQSGAFEHHCYAAGLRVQHGPEWQLQVWERTTKTKPGEVIS